MKQDLPERIYLQEIEAEFVEDGGGVFRKVRDAVREDISRTPDSHIVIGVDWGKLNDFTVFTVFDAAQGAVLSIDRSNKVDYHVQVQRLKALCDKWKPRVIVAESNSMGEPIIEQLRREGLPVRPFLTTASSKAEAIESLSLAFEQGSIQIPNDIVLIQELEAYEMERLPSGNIRYNAPAGMHDDMVMSLALAFTQTATRRSWLFN
jgi:phage terminase large subunit-like protein